MGSRPAKLQEFVIEAKADDRPFEDIYREARAWYARNRGETTHRELLEVLDEARQDR